MPIIEVTLAEGRSAAMVRTLISELTSAARKALQVQPETVRVLVREIPRAHWASADVTLAERYATAADSGRSDPKAEHP